MKILKNEHYIGRKVALQTRRNIKTKEILHNDESEWYINDHAFPPILECEVFEQVQKRFVQTDEKHDTTPKHIMCRKLYCAGCGKTLKRDGRFRCKNGYMTGAVPCFQGSISQDTLYSFVLDKVKQYLAPELKRRSPSVSIAETEKEIAALKEEKAVIFENLFHGQITQDVFAERNASVTKRIQEAEERLAECRRAAALNSVYGMKERPIDMLRRLYEATELTGEHMQFIKRIDVYDVHHFEVHLQEDSPLAVLCRNVDFYQSV